MLARAVPTWLLAAGLVGTVVGLVAAFFLARLALTAIARVAAHRGSRLALLSLAMLVVVLFALQPARKTHAEGLFAAPVTPTYVSQAGYVLAFTAPGPELGPSPDALHSELRALDGADVLVVFVESYGAVTYETPDLAAALADSRADLQAAARETGRQVISAYVDPPTFGASSWLSHLSLMTGVDVRDQYAYTIADGIGPGHPRPRPSAVEATARVALMPGMRQAWPEGAFYGFDVIYGRDLLEYRGTAVRVVEHPGPVRPGALRRARAHARVARTALRRVSDEHDPRAVRPRAPVPAGLVSAC